MITTLDDLLKQSAGESALDLPSDKDDIFPPEGESLTGNPKTEARLLSVQALYQHLQTEDAFKHIREDYLSSYVRVREADKKLFRVLVDDIAENHARYTELVEAQLAEGWNLTRLGLVERCLLMTAASELTCRLDTPYKVVINEFVNISKGFLEQEGVSFVNAAVDKLARKIRPTDFS